MRDGDAQILGRGEAGVRWLGFWLVVWLIRAQLDLPGTVDETTILQLYRLSWGVSLPSIGPR